MPALSSTRVVRAFALAVFVALVSVLPAAASGSGLRGIVTRGPVTPVCTAESPCSAPAKHVLLTFSRNGVSRSVTTGDDGRYAIRLAPGTWSVQLGGATKLGRYTPRTAVVRTGVMRTLNVSIDTGIR